MILRRVSFLSMLACLGLAPAAFADEEAAPAVLALGQPAPLTSVEMKSVDGKEVSIAEVAGKKGTLVIFACNGCPWVKAWEKRMVEIGNTYTKRGIGVIVINANDAERSPADGYAEMQQRAKERGMRYAYVMDGTSDVARAFGATRTPEVFLFDAGGKLVYHGVIDDNAHEPNKVTKRYLRDALDAVLAGKAVAVTETKSLGCTIKFRPKA